MKNQFRRFLFQHNAIHSANAFLTLIGEKVHVGKNIIPLYVLPVSMQGAPHNGATGSIPETAIVFYFVKLFTATCKKFRKIFRDDIPFIESYNWIYILEKLLKTIEHFVYNENQVIKIESVKKSARIILPYTQHTRIKRRVFYHREFWSARLCCSTTR